MQRDFHYYCVGVLANAAGFSSRDSLAIAYASQYVDDSTESELIEIVGPMGEFKFDPVRTAHLGLGALTWSVEKRIYMPFHFIPPEPFQPPMRFSFITKADSKFARMLLDEAASEPAEHHRRRLCRIGIALHTYADTWSHQGFSGRLNPENDVEEISLYDASEKRYKRLLWSNFYLDFAPQVGHTEAGYFPDQGFRKMKWRFPARKPEYAYAARDNLKEFLTAAERIYYWLREIDKPGKNIRSPGLLSARVSRSS